MRHVGKSKIGKLSAKGIEYPQLSLPKQYPNVIGKNAEIYEAEHDGKCAFLIVTQEKVSESNAVLKSEAEVLKQRRYEVFNDCLSALESQIADLKNIILKKESESDSEKENQRPRARFAPRRGLHRCLILI